MTSDRYLAFISYHHKSGSAFARRFEQDLKAYAKPLFKRPHRIFRDEKHFAPGANLPELIRSALRDSDYLILLATPESAQSHWVQDEIALWFQELNRPSSFMIVLLDGEIALDARSKHIDWSKTNALPPNLAKFVSEIPLYADVRSIVRAGATDLQNPDYKRVINGVVARLRRIDPNDMLGEEVREHNRTLRIRNYGVCALALSAFVAVAAYVAYDRLNDTAHARLLASESQQPEERIDVALLKAEAANSLSESVDTERAIRLLAERASSTRAIFGVSFPIVSTALDDRGILLAVGGDRGQVVVWDTEARALAYEGSVETTQRIVDVGFVGSGGGTQVLALTASGRVCAARTQLRAPLVCQQTDLEVPILGWSQTRESTRFVVAHGVARFSVVDSRDSTVISSFELPDWLYPSQRDVKAWAFDRVTEQVAVATLDGTISIYSLAGERGPTVLEAPQFETIALGFDTVTSALFVAGESTSVRMWTRDGALAEEWWTLPSNVAATAIAASNGRIIVAGEDNVLYRGSADSGSALTPSPLLHRTRVSRVLSNSESIVSVSEDGTSIIWVDEAAQRVTLPEITSPYSELQFGNDNAELLAGTDSGEVFTWTLGQPPSYRLLAKQTTRIRAMAVSTRRRQIAFGGQDEFVGLVDLRSGAEASIPTADPFDYVMALAFHPSNGALIVGMDRGRLEIWNTSSSTAPRPWEPAGAAAEPGHRNTLCCVAFTRDGNRLLTADNDGMILSRFVNSGAADGAPRRIHSGIVSALRPTHRADEIISAGMDGALVSWELPAMIERCRMRHPDDSIVLAAAHAEEVPRLVSVSVSGVVLWNSETCERLRHIEVPGGPDAAAAISSHGDVIAWSTPNRGIEVVTLESIGELRSWVCARVRVTEALKIVLSTSATGRSAAGACARS